MLVEIEEWRDIQRFEGFYQISNHGRLKSYKQSPHGKVLKQTNQKGDYFSVVLQAAGEIRHTRLHRLVAEAFIPNPDNLPQINHKDGNKQNNHVNNLEWCTSSYNVRHSMKLHPHQCDKLKLYNQYIRPKMIQMLDKQGNLLRLFVNASEASKETGICCRNILQVCNGDRNEHGYLRKTAGGFIWRFEGEVMP